MTDTYNDTTGSRKKFLIPLVVLLLCAVSLTGAGYAYNATVTVNNNTADADQFVLEVYDDTTTALLSEPISLKSLDLYSETIVNKAPTADKVTVKAETIANSYIGMLTIKDSNKAGETEVAMTVSVEATNGDVTFTEVNTITADAGATSGNIAYTVTANLYEDDACTGPTYDGKLDFDANGLATLYYKITIEADGEGIVFANATAQDDVTNVYKALQKEFFTLTFSATAVA